MQIPRLHPELTKSDSPWKGSGKLAIGLTNSQGDSYKRHLVNNGLDEDKEQLKNC